MDLMMFNSRVALLLVVFSPACAAPLQSDHGISSTSDTSEKLQYSLKDSKDVESLWNALDLPVTTLDRTYSAKEFRTSNSEVMIYCKHTEKPASVEPNRGSCDFSVNKDKNGQYFSQESSAKALFEALKPEGSSRSGTVKYFESSDKKVQIYCAQDNMPTTPYTFFCWVKI
jgi:hypothetical protein